MIGVADDSHLRTLRTASPIIYVPWRQMDFWQFEFAMRTRGDLAAVLPAMRRELVPIDPQLKLWYVHPTDELLAGAARAAANERVPHVGLRRRRAAAGGDRACTV